MSDTNSFDITSTVDMQEVKNAVAQAEKEIGNRYDLKGAKAVLELDKEGLTLESSDEFTLKQALEVLQGKFTRRGIHLKSLRYATLEPASGGRVRQKITLQQGIPQETAKRIVAEIKKTKIKVQASIQGDSVRVSGKKRDDLQEVMALLRGLELDVPLDFGNYRS